MNDQRPIDVAALLAEVMRYLATVDVFRAEGCEPRWRPETADRVAPMNLRGYAAVPAA
jgi:hypothetical protein